MRQFHIFYPLKIYTNSSFESVCNSIENSELIFTEKSIEIIRETFSQLHIVTKENIDIDTEEKAWTYISSNIDTLNEHITRIQTEKEKAKKFYGSNFTNSYQRFLLQPINIELNNKISVWLYATFYYFSNNMGVIKLEFPLRNASSSPLKNRTEDQYLSKILHTWCDDFSAQNKLIDIWRFICMERNY